MPRIPHRIRRHIRTVVLLENWLEFLRADLTRGDLASVRTRRGIVLEARRGANLKYLFLEIWLSRVYTPPGYEIHAGDVVMDIGANIGVFSTFAASTAPRTRVFAYEPFSESAACLRSNVRASGLHNVAVFEQAVCSGRGRRVLSIESGNWVMHTLAGNGAAPAAGARGGFPERTVEVDCVGLDDVFRDNGIVRCNLLKVDCEGSEYEIFEASSQDTMDRIDRIVIEYHEGPKFAGTGAQLRDVLIDRGFAVDHFVPGGEGTGYICARSKRLRKAP
ncbi:MAG TPA: FkbM family methyltransferase [Gemmatimonadaceae bacterium]